MNKKVNQLVVLLIIAAFASHAQDSEYLKLWNKYHDECSEMVNDTLIEPGVVNYNVIPVDGEFKLIPIDTVWSIENCREYKESVYDYSESIYWNERGFLNTINCIIDTLACINCIIDTLACIEWVTTGSTKEQFTTTITREKVCRMKLRRPTQNGYWEWLKEKGYRK